MKRSFRARGVAFAAVAGLALAVPFALPAASALPQHVACAKIFVPPSSNKTAKSYIANCTPTSLSAGATSAFTQPPAGTKSGTLKGTFTWKNSKGKTVGLVTFALQATRGKCPVGTTRVKIGGKVTGGSGAAAKIIKTNEPISGSICAYTAGAKSGSATLEPGTKWKM